MGLREQKKQEKMARIKAAARQLFEEKGFDATTTREIAAQAGIGTGTLFLYVRDKRELLFLIFSEVVSGIVRNAFSRLPKDTCLLDSLLFLFSGFFQAYAKNPKLSRIYVKELLYMEGPTREAYQVFFEDFLSRVALILNQAQSRGELRKGVDLMTLTFNIFGLYGVTVTFWLEAETPDPDEGLARLRKSLDLHLTGVLAETGS